MRWPISWFQFSLSKLFALVTLCAVGTWYWYQRPYPVDEWVESLWGVCPVGRSASDPPPPKDYREVRYYRRVRGKQPVQHGPYYGYDAKGTLLRRGYYRDGWQVGEFADYGPTGGKTTWTMVRGQIDGERRSWDDRGQLLEFAEYVNGQRQGPSRKWDSNGNLLNDENYSANVLHGLYFNRDENTLHTTSGWFEHGVPTGSWKWMLHDSDIKQIAGEWQAGLPVGRWEWTDRDGKQKLVAEFASGRVVYVEPTGFSPRVIEEVVQRTSRNPEGLAYSFSHTADSDPRELSLEKLIDRICLFEFHTMAELEGLKLAKLDGKSIVVLEPHGISWLFALRDTLARHNLGIDLRYGTPCIDTLDGIAMWSDPTGVLSIVPPVRSRFHKEWSDSTWIDVVEMPLQDVLQFLSDLHEVQFDTSRLEGTAVSEKTGVTLETPITLKIVGRLSFRDGLGILLRQLGLHASMRGNAIEIGPQ